MASLHEILNIRLGVTSVIGSGGKTTLIGQLAHEISVSRRVIVTTTTKMLPLEGIPVYTGDDISEMIEMLFANNALSVGTMTNERKLKTPATDIKELARLAPYILAECDGSKRLPLKAHRNFEPVIPECSANVIAVLGLSGIGKTIGEAVHCPALYADMAGLSEKDTVTPDIAAKTLVKEYNGDKHIRFDTLILNQAETEKDIRNAEKIARIIHNEIPAGVFYGNVGKGELLCLY